MRLRLGTAVLLAAVLLAAATARATLPAGFSDNLVAAVGSPTALAFTPDGRLLITSQVGDLRVVTPGGALLPTPALSLGTRVCSNSERGLLGVAVDPTFATNHFVYLYYTFNKNPASTPACATLVSTVPVERVSRYTLPDTNVIDPASELVLIDNVLNWAGNHNGGNVLFGPDGFLYFSIGDGGCDYAGDSGCQGANDASRDRNVLNGKVLRIAPDGSIPASNPFHGAGTARCNAGPAAPGLICQETFAWGLRNPFRFTFQPGTGTLFINDVGEGAFEEVDVGQAGADYGWPCREGAHPNLTTGKCSPTPPLLVEPLFEYQHVVAIPGTTATGCGAITGGAFVPAHVWTGFDGAYLFTDVNCGDIVRLNVVGATATASDFETGGAANVHLLFGPSAAGQSLYYTTYAVGGQVRRIDGPPAPPPPSSTFTTLTPCRILDTRDPVSGPSLQPGASRTFAIAGRCGVPLDAVAVAANVTVANATTAGSLRIGPAGTGFALDSLDFHAGMPRANNATLGLFGAPAGSVTVSSGFASGTADLVIDVTGYYR